MLGAAGQDDRDKRAQQERDDADLTARAERLLADSERSLTLPVGEDARSAAETEVARLTGRPVALTIEVFDRGAASGHSVEVYRDGALYGRHGSPEAAQQFVRQMGWGDVPVTFEPVPRRAPPMPRDRTDE